MTSKQPTIATSNAWAAHKDKPSTDKIDEQIFMMSAASAMRFRRARQPCQAARVSVCRSYRVLDY